MKLSIILASAVLYVAGCTHVNKTTASSAPAPTRAVAQYPIITKLVGRHQTIVISAGPESALYSIQSPAGQVLVANASFEELRDKHPEYFRYIQPLVANDASYLIAGIAGAE